MLKFKKGGSPGLDGGLIEKKGSIHFWATGVPNRKKKRGWVNFFFGGFWGFGYLVWGKNIGNFFPPKGGEGFGGAGFLGFESPLNLKLLFLK